MRKVIAMLWSIAAGVGLVGGCGWMPMDLCADGACPSPEPTCTEDCVIYMDASWDMALVGRKPKDGTPFRCPDSTTDAGLYGEEIDVGRGPPLRVLACSVLPEPTCSNPRQVCVPYERDFAPCVLQLGEQFCPASYTARTLVINDTGYTFTICCEDPGEPT